MALVYLIFFFDELRSFLDALLLLPPQLHLSSYEENFFSQSCSTSSPLAILFFVICFLCVCFFLFLFFLYIFLFVQFSKSQAMPVSADFYLPRDRRSTTDKSALCRFIHIAAVMPLSRNNKRGYAVVWGGAVGRRRRERRTFRMGFTVSSAKSILIG